MGSMRNIPLVSAARRIPYFWSEAKACKNTFHRLYETYQLTRIDWLAKSSEHRKIRYIRSMATMDLRAMNLTTHAFSMLHQKRYQEITLLLENMDPGKASILAARLYCYNQGKLNKEKLEFPRDFQKTIAEFIKGSEHSYFAAFAPDAHSDDIEKLFVPNLDEKNTIRYRDQLFSIAKKMYSRDSDRHHLLILNLFELTGTVEARGYIYERWAPAMPRLADSFSRACECETGYA